MPLTLTDLAGLDLTYAEHGATRGDLPPGYHYVTRHIQIGQGADQFDAASTGLCAWQMHKRCHMTVQTSSGLQAGQNVLMRVGFGPVRLTTPCRVIYTVDESHRRGFAYGTLPGHVESGEEAFVVTHENDDSVWLDITAFSRPAAALMKTAGPVGRFGQSFMIDRYVAAMRALAKSGAN
jgi:uncharacterized protein (UPF0548 family)